MAHVIRKGRGIVLVYGGCMFQRKKMRTQTMYWKCCTRGCTSRLRINVFEINDQNANNNIHVEHVSLHNHMEEYNRIERQLLVNEMVSTIHRVYDTVVNNENNILRENVPGFNNIRSTLQRARTDMIPRIPQVPADVIIENDWAVTWAGERLLLENDQERGIVVFATDTDLRLLLRCETIFADGTFKSSPVPYTQFFTVHGEIGGYVLKFACGLLANKEAQSYARVFQVLKERIFNLFWSSSIS